MWTAFFMALNEETRQDLAGLEDPGFKALVVGSEVIFPPMQVGERAYHFDHAQISFLYQLQRFRGDVAKAAECVNKSLDWANKFLASRKFRSFRNAKLASMSVRNGDLVEWWWKYGLDGAKGKKEWYEGVCHLCHEKNEFETAEAEMFRNDDMTFAAKCKVCFQAIAIERKEIPQTHSREQVQFWSELGNRLAPKIERVQHEFTNEKFTFVEGDAA